MRLLRRFVFVGLFAPAVLAAPAAMSADMPQTLPPPPPPTVVIHNGGWYLRGDVGYYWGHVGSAESALPFPNPTSNSLGNGFVGGIGAGYKSDWLRTDITVDYTSAMKYKGTIVSADDTSAKVTAVTALFNGYLDLGTWYRATPYLGGGVGVSQLRTTDYTSTAAPPFTGDNSNTQYKFTWALMAGVGYAIAPNMMADVGYRYVNFGDVSTGSDAFGAMTLKNLAAHEVRVGVRWMFDDLAIVR